MNFKRLRKSVRQEAIAAGVIRKAASETGFTAATVSRTFAGRFDRPNPVIVAALVRVMAELGIEGAA